MSDEFPLCKKLGLEHRRNGIMPDGYIKAADLEKILQEAPAVNGFYEPGKKSEGFGTRIRPENASHSARLLMIEELKPKECKHAPMINHLYSGIPCGFYCAICNAKLKAKWEVADE